MDENDSRSLLQNILGFFARKPQTPPSQQASLRSQTLDAWVRADAYLQHESNDLAEVDPEQVSRTLRAFENLVEYDSNYETDDAVGNSHSRYTPFLPTNAESSRRTCTTQPHRTRTFGQFVA